jgi:hypothetical protein
MTEERFALSNQVQTLVDEIETLLLKYQELSDIEIVGALHVIAHKAVIGAYDLDD